MSSYLITGAAGFIGSNLCEELLNNGHTVIGLDNLSKGEQKNIDRLNRLPQASSFTFLNGDIRDLETCQNACKNVDYVLHQAALGSVPLSLKHPLLYEENNVGGLLNMLISARDNNIKRFVFASSSSIYGDTEILPKIETMTPLPKSPYAISKISGEYYCNMFYKTYGLPTISLRYFNVFGKYQSPTSAYAAVIPSFITSSLSNKPHIIYGDGEQTRDFTYIKNVVLANINACQAKKTAFGEVINIGCGYKIKINELSKNIRTLLHSDLQPIYKPLRAGDVKDSLADIQKSKDLLNLSGSILLKEGLLETTNWYKDNSQ